MASILWFRLDLRLADHAALTAALEHGGPVVPVFIWSPEEEGAWPPGGASQWWLHQSLSKLEAALAARGSRLIIRRGPALAALRSLAAETGAGAVFWSRRYEPALTARDAAVKESLRRDGMRVESSNAALLHEPWEIKNKSGRPFQVFTPFWKHCLSQPDPAKPLPAPHRIPAPENWPSSLRLEELGLEPKIPWDTGMRAFWEPGEDGARRRLTEFLAEGFASYSDERNRPDHAGTSRLSPHLHFGEISPRQIWHALRQQEGAWRQSQFIAEIGWREFAHHLLFHFPHTPDEPLRSEWKDFPAIDDGAALAAWAKGRTGYPIVDAGMRELWSTGWMHNRVRMIVASFLVKDLFLSWKEGAKWFWDTLVDADLASNTLGWQWSAGCGADAAPYFRIFNPVSQGQKFDPGGEYVRKWVPELRGLDASLIHAPWLAPPEALRRAGIHLGSSYPMPIVDHAAARQRALDAYKRRGDSR